MSQTPSPAAPPAPEGAYSDLDSGSSRPLHPAAREVLLAALDHGWSDPRRLHREGRRARLLLDNAREAIGDALGVRPDEVTFTGSGTEAVHRGLIGLHRGRRRAGTTILHSAVEHSSVLHAADWCTREFGALSASLPVTHNGTVTPDAVTDALVTHHAGAVTLAAVQHANHEVGTVHDLEAVAEALGDVPLFTDACASWGHSPVPAVWQVAAASPHKWGGPAGIGLLLVRKGARWRPGSPTDDRSDPRAVGFENIPAALASAAALRAVQDERTVVSARQRALVDRIRASVARIPDVEVVGDPDRRLPHLVTFSCLYVDGESLVHELDRTGFGVASGSACTSSTMAPSHVLAAMGALTHGNVRLSLHSTTTKAEVERFLDVLPGVVRTLRARVGM